MPDLYSYLGIQEKAMDYSLPWDTTRAVSYQKWNGWSPNITALKLASAQRVNKSKAFQLITQDVARLKKQKEFSKESLRFSDFMANQKLLKEEADQLQNLPIAQGTEIKITKPKADDETLSNPNYQKTKDWLKQIGKDVYINEAWHILNDMNS